MQKNIPGKLCFFPSIDVIIHMLDTYNFKIWLLRKCFQRLVPEKNIHRRIESSATAKRVEHVKPTQDT